MIKGFTLLETLLVIVIISLMTTVGISFYRAYTINTKVETAAQQIQALLQAGVAYYIDQEKWPDINKPLPVDFSAYLSFNPQQNPWGNYPYIYQPTADDIKFQVIAQVPGNLADRVIALLPGGEKAINCVPSSAMCQITTEIPAPIKGTKVLPSNYIIKAIGNWRGSLDGDGNATIQTPGTAFSCPDSSWAPRVTAGFTSVWIADQSQDVMYWCGKLFPQSISYLRAAESYSCTGTGQPNNYTCQLNIRATVPYIRLTIPFCHIDGKKPNKGLGSVGVTYYVYCCKKDTNGNCLPPD